MKRAAGRIMRIKRRELLYPSSNCLNRIKRINGFAGIDDQIKRMTGLMPGFQGFPGM